MKIRLYLLPFFLLFASLLPAGGTQEAETPAQDQSGQVPPLMIRDSLDRTVTLPALPERIVQAGSSAFIVNDALFLFPEATERVVAMTDSNQGRGRFLSIADPAYAEKTILPRTINIEEILATEPDVVILKDFLFNKYDKEFQRVGIPVIYLNLESPESWFRDLDILGTLFGNPARAEELRNLFSRYMDEVTAPLADLPAQQRKRGLILYYSETDGAGAFQVPPLTFIQTEMLEMAGADPVWTDAELGQRWTKVGFEQIAAWDPDQLFLISYRKPMGDVMGLIADSPYWQELRAFREGEIHPFPLDFHSWDQPDPRWLLGLQWMASRTHPDRYPALDLTSRAETFFREFYSLSAATYREKILPVTEGVSR